MSACTVFRPFQGLLLCLFGLLGLAACSKSVPAPEPVRAVKVMQVQAGAIAASQEYAAEVRARTESRLGFQVAGKLLARSVTVGDTVRQGQVLAQLDSQDYALAAQAAQAQAVAARTQRDLAKADWERFSALKEQGFISGVELDRRRASMQAAQAQWEQAQAQATAQANQRGYTSLVADAAGVVTAVYAEPGQVVAAGAPVVQLAHAGPRDAVFALPEQMQPQVRQGQAAQVRGWVSGQQWQGVVREVAASADPVTRTYTGKVAIAGQLQPALGATVYVQLQAGEAASAQEVVLPSTAVQSNNGQPVVWVLDGASSTVHARSVEVAGVQGNDVRIASGIQAGMQVVIAGTHLLNEGQVVTVYQPQHSQAAQ